MPAIQPARLKIQISQLIDNFDSPKDFVTSLKDFFEFYSDRTRKLGRGNHISSLTRSFKVPFQVSRQLERSLQPVVSEKPDQSLAIVDQLFQENWLECRTLAFSILGWIPPDPPELILERINNWHDELIQDRILNASLSKAIRRLWLEKPDVFFYNLESWLTSKKNEFQRLGLRILPSLIDDSEFIYIPRLFNVLTPFIRKVVLVPDSDLTEIIHALAHRSPQETAYFLRRNLTLSENPGVYSLIRQSLDAFPVDVRKDLQSFLHHQRNEMDGL